MFSILVAHFCCCMSSRGGGLSIVGVLVAKSGWRAWTEFRRMKEKMSLLGDKRCLVCDDGWGLYLANFFVVNVCLVGG